MRMLGLYNTQPDDLTLARKTSYTRTLSAYRFLSLFFNSLSPLLYINHKETCPALSSSMH